MGIDALSPLPYTSPAKIGDLVLDALMEEAEELTNKVTLFPVEDGSLFSDHVVLDARKLMIRGFVTNAPIRSHGGPQDGQARATVPFLDHVVGTSLNFAELALAYLRDLRDKKTTVVVITRRGRFENMQVTRFTRSKTKDTGDALAFSIELVEITKVKLLFVAAPTRRTSSGRAQPRAEAGKKTAAQSNDLQSWASHAKDGSTAFFTGLFK